MKYLFAVVSLFAASMPLQAETIYLLIKSEVSAASVALQLIPMESLEQCEEMGALAIASERFDTAYAKRDGFECLRGK